MRIMDVARLVDVVDGVDSVRGRLIDLMLDRHLVTRLAFV
jgi:hypothetical protein